MGSSFVLAFVLAVTLGTIAARHSEFAARCGDQPVLFRRGVDPDLLACPGADPGVRGRARLAAGGRGGNRRGERSRRSPAPSGAAGCHPDPGQRRRLYALCPRGDARGARPGPYPHRACQGRQRGPCRLSPCDAQRDDPGHDDPGAVIRRAGVRRARDRDDVRLSRNGQADLRCRHRATTTIWLWRLCCSPQPPRCWPISRPIWPMAGSTRGFPTAEQRR